MFLAFAPLGAMWPLFPRQLELLQFTPLEVGFACATQAAGMLLAPLFGQVADRWLAPERCLALGAVIVAGLLWLLAGCTTPSGVILVSLALWALLSPMLTLTNSVVFAHLDASHREFGSIRLWGTLGWVVQGWVVGHALSQPEWLGWVLSWARPEQPQVVLGDSTRLASMLALVFASYALTIPATAPRRHALDLLAPLAALRLLKQRAFAIYFFCNWTLCLSLPFVTQNLSVFLGERGVSDSWKGPALTIAQLSEILTLGLLPRTLERFGQRRVMLIGAASWALSLGILTLGQPTWLVIAGLTFNGLFITGYVVAGQMFVNSHAAAHFRASAQSLISFTSGTGLLMGYVLAGWVRQQADSAYRPTFAVGAAIASVAVFVFAWGFRSEEVHGMPQPGPEDTAELPTIV